MKIDAASRGRLMVRALAVVTTAAACSSPTSGVDDTSLRIARADKLQVEEHDDIHVLTQLQDMDEYPEALYQGGLHLDGEGCIRLTEGEDPTTALWPAGFTVRVSGDGIEILDPEGRVAGELSDEFVMGGGELPVLDESLGFTPEDHELASSRCPGKFWLVTPGEVLSREPGTP